MTELRRFCKVEFVTFGRSVSVYAKITEPFVSAAAFAPDGKIRVVLIFSNCWDSAASAPPRVKVLDLFLKFLSEKHYFSHLVWCKCCCLSPIHHAGPACSFMTHSREQVTHKEEQYLRGLAPPVLGQRR